MKDIIVHGLEHVVKRARQDKSPQTETRGSHEAVAVIGVGATGFTYLEQFARHTDTKLIGIVKPTSPRRDFLQEHFGDRVQIATDLADVLSHRPSLTIVATPNPVEPIIEEIYKSLPPEDPTQPMTFLLMQNALRIVPAWKGKMGKRTDIHADRGCFFTPVHLDTDGYPVYKPERLRMGLASIPKLDRPMGEEGVAFTREEYERLKRTEKLFQQAGYKVAVFPEYETMEGTKARSNLFVFSTAVTGRLPSEALLDRDNARFEIQANQALGQVLRAAEMPPAHTPWGSINNLSLGDALPGQIVEPIAVTYRKLIAAKAVGTRGDELTGTARRVAAGEPTEAGDYLGSVIDLAEQNGISVPEHKAMYRIMEGYETARRNEPGGIPLATLSRIERVNLLYRTTHYEKHPVKPVIPKSLQKNP